jgi:hypothetical protein
MVHNFLWYRKCVQHLEIHGSSARSPFGLPDVNAQIPFKDPNPIDTDIGGILSIDILNLAVDSHAKQSIKQFFLGQSFPSMQYRWACM